MQPFILGIGSYQKLQIGTRVMTAHVKALVQGTDRVLQWQGLYETTRNIQVQNINYCSMLKML
jgi:hypothetical protein